MYAHMSSTAAQKPRYPIKYINNVRIFDVAVVDRVAMRWLGPVCFRPSPA
jgi:hypothetical protein